MRSFYTFPHDPSLSFQGPSSMSCRVAAGLAGHEGSNITNAEESSFAELSNEMKGQSQLRSTPARFGDFSAKMRSNPEYFFVTCKV